jgi:hypothetical protein
MVNPIRVVAFKIIPAVKISGVPHESSVPVPMTSNGYVPDPCSSLSFNLMPLIGGTNPSHVSPVVKAEESNCLPDELEFDEFLLDAAEWL